MPHDPVAEAGHAVPTLHVESVLGHCADAQFAGRLHALAHDGQVDVVWLPRADMARRRMRARSMAGRDVAIALPRSQSLFDGAVLHLSPTGALLARAEAEQWLRLEPASPAAALMLGYHAGNLHWRVRFAGPALLVALDGPAEPYLDRLTALRDQFAWRLEQPGE
jgi:urease accessory protein